MAFRETNGIVSTDGDAVAEADVIMTAAALGLAALHIAGTKSPIQFDMDPLEAGKDPTKLTFLQEAVNRMDAAVAAYLEKEGKMAGYVKAGTSPGYDPGAVIMGVYALAGQSAPSKVTAPELSVEGKKLWEKIWNDNVAKQYKGRGAYTGFVDNHNTEGDTKPIGPLSSARFVAKDSDEKLPSRWLPATENELWRSRERLGKKGDVVSWGIIGGERANNKSAAKDAEKGTNEADVIIADVKAIGMEYVGGDLTKDEIAMYTHGMIQAIYRAYHLGPSCSPYEIAVGSLTKKMASCLTCTLFMTANGYPPNSIHLGRGESWAPLFSPYYPEDPHRQPTAQEAAVIRDLNNRWYEKCLEYLQTGLKVLDDTHIAESHGKSRDAVRKYLEEHATDEKAGGALILDAVTIHDGEAERIHRTLQPVA
ncbi:hypothetical protein [Terracidiphilus gabretensis]|uniref:hypothetical protein n=1 Tax=Terracidiphilus gabretensis TaxID=1577687 RepID=UPI00071B7EE6|nr:hypothetical protein [Terracidiphilus gabretensis]